jgi:hypothetical protein
MALCLRHGQEIKEDKDMIKLGQMRYDERNGRYIEPDGVGADPKVFSCLVYEISETGDLELDGRYLFTKSELEKFSIA